MLEQRMRGWAIAIAASAAVAGVSAGNAAAQTIATVAGTLAPGFSGDGGPATAAQLDRPVAVARDGNGNVFVADQTFNVIRRFTVGGDIATIAGVADISGSFAGDGGAATGASFDSPSAMAVDSSGRIFVVDAGNRRVRMFTPGGDISTVAGGGSGGGADGLGDGGPATAATLAFPQGVAVDGAGEIFVADTFDAVVRAFTVDGSIAVVAGTPGKKGFGGDGGPAAGALLASPAAVAVDAAGQIYVADNGAHVIRLFTVGGTITTIAGTPDKSGYAGDGGPATAALLKDPSGVSVDSAGNVFIADTGNGVIRKVAPGGVITTVAGGGANPGSDGVGDGGPAPVAALSMPIGVVQDGAGNILVADTGNDAIRRFSETAPAPSLFASVLPGARSVEDTAAATLFATMLNATGAALQGCQIAVPTPTPTLLQLDFQTTNPATNALTGTVDTPATIPANGAQTFLLTFTQSENTGALFSDPGQQLLFACDGTEPAPATQGVNTVDLSFSPTPVADVIALVAVPGNNGIFNFPTDGAGAFAIATDNLGSADTLTVSVDTGSAVLPLSLSLCATNAAAQCLAAPAPSVTESIAAGATPTFSIFATSQDPIAFAPATSRVFVRFKDSSGASHGSTSVAVETH
jgi:hypothetical protein